MTKVLTRSLDRRKRQVIELRLVQARDMFEMPSTDLFSEYRNFLTGVDICLSELRSRRSGRPVRLEIRMPPEAIEDGVAERLRKAVTRSGSDNPGVAAGAGRCPAHPPSGRGCRLRRAPG